MSYFTGIAGRPARPRFGVEIGIGLGAIALLTVWPSVHAVDIAVQAHFFDTGAAHWLIPPDDRGWQFRIFYKGLKIAVGLVGGGAVLWLIARATMRRWTAFDTCLVGALCVLGLTPLIVGLLKKVTGVSCPAQELFFGGPYAHVAIWDRLLSLVPYNTHLRCWPAGHASAGFGLMGVRVLAPLGERLLLRYWAPGLVAGWGLGLYQMARGQHYLSHTVVTMALAIVLSSLVLMILDRAMMQVDRG
ncbi:MAG: phosphatase PAP2 family protein [Parvibaculum sp.]|uniref:phosphatase PAP2 family protein n=1 Tax=Parvibaculum sp. TaxID=2024848 RepID=UPI00272716DA|nr:phosphatase PAP2 family protein [Parvibaculum sp.]MDO8838078.1 phosphatase PAP2 family protein [Parvibaculum sp.]